MNSINLVCTRHQELGKCNSKELYQIIENINPEIIFEEIPPSFFDKYYVTKSESNLESNTINEYIKKYKIVQVPVDSDDVPSHTFFEQLKKIYGRIEGQIDINGFNYRNFTDRNRILIEKVGFKYLNSIEHSYMNNKIFDAIENGLQKLNDEKLILVFQSWKENIEKREIQMLKNIYNYCQSTNFERAIFTIGAAHRKSLIEKIEVFQKNENIKLNWIF
jgi:hypothetical protein